MWTLRFDLHTCSSAGHYVGMFIYTVMQRIFDFSGLIRGALLFVIRDSYRKMGMKNISL